ncbi:hypothetical protein C8R45DRAFT_947032 [Mycena sanguinolenta]|nr:hypothetical protein C8R45DRAFT_947032 [Mycena sanguinolenta]
MRIVERESRTPQVKKPEALVEHNKTASGLVRQIRFFRQLVGSTGGQIVVVKSKMRDADRGGLMEHNQTTSGRFRPIRLSRQFVGSKIAVRLPLQTAHPAVERQLNCPGDEYSSHAWALPDTRIQIQISSLNDTYQASHTGSPDRPQVQPLLPEKITSIFQVPQFSSDARTNLHSSNRLGNRGPEWVSSNHADAVQPATILFQAGTPQQLRSRGLDGQNLQSHAHAPTHLASAVVGLTISAPQHVESVTTAGPVSSMEFNPHPSNYVFILRNPSRYKMRATSFVLLAAYIMAATGLPVNVVKNGLAFERGAPGWKRVDIAVPDMVRAGPGALPGESAWNKHPGSAYDQTCGSDLFFVVHAGVNFEFGIGLGYSFNATSIILAIRPSPEAVLS